MFIETLFTRKFWKQFRGLKIEKQFSQLGYVGKSII
jgi:hypothetical protein